MTRPWSVPRAMGVGCVAAVAALLLSIGYLSRPESFVLPYVAALIATAVCGLFILLATWIDTMRNPRRGVRIRPIRGFDIAAGLLLAGPSLWALRPFLPVL